MAIRQLYRTACSQNRRQPRQRHHDQPRRVGKFHERRRHIHRRRPTDVANTTEIDVSGGNGNDTISLGNAALPAQPQRQRV